ncbi:MAG: sulfite exporter TauE/SafE family protein [Hyphomicrobiaceae bacterium]
MALLAVGALGGAVVQAATGFGFAIVAAPLFLVAMNSHAALQVLVVVHLVQTVMMLRGVWALVPLRLLKTLILGALVGSPLGLLVFVRLDVNALKLAVGLLILVFTGLLVAREAGWLALRPPDPPAGGLHPHEASPLTYLTGAVSGAMTALLVMPGPPLMLYLTHAPLPHARARALAVSFFGLCYLLVTALNTFWAGMGEGVWWLAFALAPIVYAGTLMGLRLSRYLTQGAFRAAVLGLLVLSGVGAILSAL